MHIFCQGYTIFAVDSRFCSQSPKGCAGTCFGILWRVRTASQPVIRKRKRTAVFLIDMSLMICLYIFLLRCNLSSGPWCCDMGDAILSYCILTIALCVSYLAVINGVVKLKFSLLISLKFNPSSCISQFLYLA